MATKKPWAELLDGPGKATKSDRTTERAAAPEAPPTTVYMHTVIGNPGNPRTDLDYTDEDAEFRELKSSMRSVGQLQPAVAMSSAAFRQAKPEHAESLGDADWVIVLGNRRYHAAKQLGWTKFEIRVRDRLGHAEDDKVDEAVIIENIHRKNIPPYKEAEFLQRMVERHGSQEKVAERIGKSQMYVSNRLTLLNLTPELRDVVDNKQIKVKTAQQISRIKDPAAQKAKAAEEILKSSQPRKPRKERKSTANDEQLQNPVLTPAAAGAKRSAEDEGPDGPDDHDAPPQNRVPEPRPSHTTDDEREPYAPPGPPWDDGATLMDTAFQKLNSAQRSAFIQRYFVLSRGVDTVTADLKGTLTPQARASLATILRAVADGLLDDAES
ncbi:ParB/RepB/Spo0J family partition protein (plasmid) [Streptomyces sp. NBC_01260]|uniref:ParB/RepB/Spo0J family partition protein n=1 Tax=unclassified Streptomyces TaxID=2593676 RepID=UPI000F475573|nr:MULTISPECIES: ParB/RepB/Spo0J family partition protein [unclassified Streptomyces]ROQ65337.1 ParB family chromosome partitioning protein [Streptomyces sp. CEV 2-1]RPK33112.1 Chromosome-partitioning protein Spo0J [Streptomyces sp. ADI92-24]